MKHSRFDSISGFHYRKNIRNGILYLSLLVLILQTVYWFADFSFLFSSPRVDKKQWAAFKQKMDSIERQGKENNHKKLFFFDPDTLSISNWENLGFSLKQSEAIIRYKKAIGGFTNKEQLSKSYVISDKKFKKIEPYIKFQEYISKHHNIKQQKQIKKRDINKATREDMKRVRGIGVIRANHNIKQQKQIKKRDINKATREDMKRVRGIGAIRAKIAINYRNALGGFALLSQINKVYGLENLPLVEVEKYFYVNPKYIKKINLATASIELLSKHLLLSKSQTNRIAIYRDKADNPSLHELFEYREFSSENIELLRHYFYLGNNKIATHNKQ